MELLLILTYSAICVAVFKIFGIPVNKWTLPTAALGGIFLLSGILLVMNYNHPFTQNARIYFATTPIMPNVKGRVIEVPVEPNAPLKQGDILFKIDPQPLPVRCRSKEGAARGGGAERQTAQGCL
jgi:multidrug resistance efflux pump